MPCSPYVLDASAIIQIKTDVRAADQWELLKSLETLVEAGAVCFPREVGREVKEFAYPDAPGVWVHGVERKSKHPLDPSDGVLRLVLATAGEVVDPDRAINGDAQVLALANELTADGHEATVVSEDFVDRNPKLSVQTACVRLGLPHMRLADFLTAISV
jgi:rRNA maturation endonuclease Nob1